MRGGGKPLKNYKNAADHRPAPVCFWSASQRQLSRSKVLPERLSALLAPGPPVPAKLYSHGSGSAP